MRRRLGAVVFAAMALRLDAALAQDEGQLLTNALRAENLISWSDSFRVSLFSSPPQVDGTSSLAAIIESTISRKEAAIAEAYDYILRYAELPSVRIPDRDRLLRDAQQILNRRTRCPISGKYVSCRAFESSLAFRDQWYAAALKPQSPASEAELQRIQRNWDTIGFRREVAIAISVSQEIGTLDSKFLLYDLQRDFLAYGGSAWINSGVGPFTHVDLDRLNDRERWRQFDANGATVSFSLVRIQRPWFDFGIVSRFSWRLNRASPAGSSMKFSDGNSCDLPLGCIPQWVILTRTGVQQYNVVGTVDVQSPHVPEVGNAFGLLGKESISRSGSFSDLLARLDVATF
jgi:hypothetical protein